MVIGLFTFYYNLQNNQLMCLGICGLRFPLKGCLPHSYPIRLVFLEAMVVKIIILSVVQRCECTTCGSQPLRGPLPFGPGVICVAVHHGRSDDVLLSRVGYETHHDSCLALSGHLLMEASCHAALWKRPLGKELWLLTNGQGGTRSPGTATTVSPNQTVKWYSLPCHPIPHQPDILTTISWQTQSQYHPIKTLALQLLVTKAVREWNVCCV